MAAYNSGPGTVQRAVQRTGYADFWELYRRDVLPKETRNYVPIIVAVAIMAKNPAQYDLEDVVQETAPKVDVVKINYPADLRLIAECADTSVDTLQELNPSLLRMTTPKDREFQLRLPAGSADKFQAAIASIPQEMRVWWRYHKVQPGETLSQVAQRYRTTGRAIAEANNLEDGEVSTETKLIIPVTPGKRGADISVDSAAYAKRATRYKVRKGDTVLSVADDFSVPVERLRKWNHLKGNQLKQGRSLLIYRPVAGTAASEPTTARRRKGTKGPTAVSLKSKKAADPEDDSQETTTPKSQKQKGLKSNGKSASAKKVHKVKSGETLYSIASEYNTTVAELKKNNGKQASNLRAGNVLIIK
jgi:membrane-bound lytic murein transglycosylase D